MKATIKNLLINHWSLVNKGSKEVLTAMLTIVALTTWQQAGWAQNTEESIRQRYNDMKKYVASHTNDNKDDGADFGEFYHLQARQWLPATGGHIEDTYLFFGEVESEEDVIYVPHYVKFVTKKFNYAAREYYQEFLYDPDGNVAFIYAYDPMTKFGNDADDMQYEFRFYLNKGKLIKAIIKCKRYDESAFKQVWTGTSLKSLYQSSYDEYLGVANSMKELFVNIEKEAYRLSTKP